MYVFCSERMGEGEKENRERSRATAKVRVSTAGNDEHWLASFTFALWIS